MAVLGGGLFYRGVTGHCTCYQALGIDTAQSHGERFRIPAGQGIKVEERVTIHCSPEELYGYWRNLANLPRFMQHLELVQPTDDKHSHWVTKGPLGSRFEWDAEIITERENELIGWRSLAGSGVDTAGSVHFRRIPGEDATEVRVILKYDPPMGKAGEAVAWLLGESPGRQIHEDLHQFKRLMETEASPVATGQFR